jgi:hypothetical protein
MGFDGIKETLFNHLEGLKKKGTLKGGETVITGVKPAQGRSGPRYHI